MKDVFISHSWNDKSLIDPIVSALQKNGLSCWYDSLEIIPGDLLTEKINHGLKNSKVILFCLSENFMSGQWTKAELNAAFGLAKLPNTTSMIIPLMMCPPEKIVYAYPIPFANMVYIQYQNNIDHIISEIKKALAKINNLGKHYWYNEGKKLYVENNPPKALIFLKKALDHDPLFLPALVYYILILSEHHEISLITKLIEERNDNWDKLDKNGLDVSILDKVQEYLSKSVTSYDIDSYEYKTSLLDFLYIEDNRGRSWKYFINLLDTNNFGIHQESMIGAMMINGKEQVADYFIDLAERVNEKGLKKQLGDVYYVLGKKMPGAKDRILNSIRLLLNDEDEDIRSSGMLPYYYLADDGPDYVFDCLKAKTPEVRYQALLLLTNKYEQAITDDWMPGERIESETDGRLSSQVVIDLLNDPIEVVRLEAQKFVNKGWLLKPHYKKVSFKNEDDEEVFVEELSSDITPQNARKLLNIAEHSPFKHIRKLAIEKLNESDFIVDDDIIMQLYNNEEAKSVKRELEDMIVIKATAKLTPEIIKLISKISSFATDSSGLYFVEKAYKKVMDIGIIQQKQEAIKILIDNKLYKILADNIDELLRLEYNDDYHQIFTWGFANLESKTNLILVAGKFKTHLECIKNEFASYKTKCTYVAIIRALAHNRQIENPLYLLRSLISEFTDDVDKDDNNDELWAAVSAIDGIMELSGKEEALAILLNYYNKIKPDWIFLFRAVWERMKILGHLEPNNIFERAGKAIPYGWYNYDGPIYSITHN